MCHWEYRTLQFVDQGKDIILQGVKLVDSMVQPAQIDQVLKWGKGNDIWAFAVVEQLAEPSQDQLDSPLESILEQFKDVFEEPTSLPPHKSYDHHIPLILEAVPVNARPYKYSPQHKDEIEKQVKELLAKGLITTSTSPFASPVLLVLKKDGSWRFCVDYRRLNALTIKNSFPMPLIEEILDELAGTKYFTKLYMRSGYHQVRMQVGDEYKTAFKTHQGHYQFRVMPFGLTNTPATFQCIMNEVLAPFCANL
jgi:hypothetical protein